MEALVVRYPWPISVKECGIRRKYAQLLVRTVAGTQTSTVVPAPGSVWMTSRDPMRCGTLVHPGEAQRFAVAVLGAFWQFKPDPIIPYQESQTTFLEVQSNRNPPSLCMSFDIGDRFLRDAEQCQLDGWRESSFLSGDSERRLEMASLASLSEGLVDGGNQT